MFYKTRERKALDNLLKHIQDPSVIKGRKDIMEQRIYFIAGPMSGIPNDNKAEFFKAERWLKNIMLFAVVLNPAKNPPGLTDEQYMELCKPMIKVATHVYFLKGWLKSSGAITEHGWAQEYEKIIEYQQESY
jgi:hypothetical protein